MIAEPDPRALAEVIDALWMDREHTRRMGQAAKVRVQELKINWDHVLERLLS